MNHEPRNCVPVKILLTRIWIGFFRLGGSPYPSWAVWLDGLPFGLSLSSVQSVLAAGGAFFCRINKLNWCYMVPNGNVLLLTKVLTNTNLNYRYTNFQICRFTSVFDFIKIIIIWFLIAYAYDFSMKEKKTYCQRFSSLQEIGFR